MDYRFHVNFPIRSSVAAATGAALLGLLAGPTAAQSVTTRPANSQTSQTRSAATTQSDEDAPTKVPPLLVYRSELSTKTLGAIRRGAGYLLAQQDADGSFEVKGEEADHDASQAGGRTALVTLALLSARQSHQSQPIQKAVAYLKRCKPNGTYAVGLRACVFAMLPESMRGQNLRDDLRWLQQAMISRGDGDGTYSYTYAPNRNVVGDLSNSQYGVLGVWYAQQAGLEVPLSYWRRVETAWRRSQTDDGGFGYTPGRRRAYGSMTAAGAATLHLTNDYLHAADSQNLSVPALNKPLDESIAWLGKHFTVDLNPGLDTPLAGAGMDDGFGGFGGFPGLRPRRETPGGKWVHYMLFSYERVGEASGLTRFGDHVWFDEGARFLIRTQEYDGRWYASEADNYDDVCASAYAMLFLSRGNAPVAIQKLQYSSVGTAPRWNNRSRDVGNFIRFMRRATERHLNWQIVSADATPAEFDEAPLLYLSGDRPPKLTDAQKQNLLRYVRRGGMLVCVNEGPTPDFARGIEVLAKELWPDYAFRDLPQNHPIFSANFPVKNPEAVRGLSNGVRDLVVLFPSGDMTWKWQSNGGAISLKQSPYATLANLFLYATGSAALREKGETTWCARNEAAPLASAVKVARLRYAGNWDPEPAGWERVANILHNANEVEVTPLPVSLSGGILGADYALAHLTATDAIDLNPNEVDAIKNYLDRGGFLLADAAGGSTEASQGIRLLLGKLYPNHPLTPLPIDHPIYAGELPGRPIEEVSYRRSSEGRLAPTKLPRLKGLTVDGRLVAVVSDEDLTAAMVGYTAGAALVGYSPASARDLVRNICAWRLNTARAPRP